MCRPATLPVILACALWCVPGSAAVAGGPAPQVRREPAIEAAAPALTSRELAQALLAETNRVRRVHHRRPLKPRPELEAAADDQAAFMALRMHAQHGSFLPGQETAAQRVRRHGLEGVAVAENVASTSLGKSGQGFSAEKIAALLVEQWMNSPGHRANLLDRRHTHFGGAVRLTRMVGGEWAAFGAQVFFIARPPFGHVSS